LKEEAAMKKLKNLIMPIALVVSLTLMAACTKKRDAELPYGEDRDLQTLAAFEGKEFDLQTFDVIKASNSSAKISTIKLSDDRKDTKNKIKNFSFVKYKSEDPLKLTDDTLMLGLPNHKYKVKYLFQGTLLKVMKLAPAEDLSTDELTAAIDNKDGRLMVPIVSYSISLYSIDKRRNDQNEATSKLELISLQGLAGATHFKIDFNSKTRATFLSKTTVLPASFFGDGTGETSDWYYAMTVVGQNVHEKWQYVGMNIGLDKYDRTATKVRAKKDENKIVFFNLGIDERLEKTLNARSENQMVVVTLPVEFVDYQFSESGRTSSVREENIKDRAWDRRDYVDLKVSEVKTAGEDLQFSEVKDVQVGDGYLSFTLKSEKIAALVRFSFYNVKTYQQEAATKYGAKPYQPKIYFPEDEKLFGFFGDYRESLDTFESNRQSKAERRNHMNRFNPTRTVIEYRLNHEAPDWAEEIVKKAVNGWNATFQAAGSATRIRITDESGKVLRGHPGDLRYSLINFLFEADGADKGWGGFGPKISDPNTGEIIMATANVSATDRIEGMKSVLNSYLLSVKGELDKKYLMGFSFPSFQVVLQAAQNTIRMMGRSDNDPLESKRLWIYDQEAKSFLKNLQTEVAAQPVQITFSNQSRFENRVETINKDIIEAARKVCPKLRNYVDQIQSSKNERIDAEKELQIVSRCALEVAKPVITFVLSHEIGHNMGLRHNFYGSTDAANFFSAVPLRVGDDVVQANWKSSSVMDYIPMNYEVMTQPGRYDIAAIRWGYQNNVETKDGKIVSVNPDKATILQLSTQMRPYKYCTDEDVSVFAKDALCAKNDIGSDPEQIASQLITEYEASMALWNNRLDKARTEDMLTLASWRKSLYLKPMLKFYEMWRLILAKEAGGGQEYLDAVDSEESYKELIKKVLDESKHGKAQADWNKKYQNAVSKIFEFLTRIAFMPDASCVTTRVVNDKETIQLFSLSNLQKDLFKQTGRTFLSCHDKEVQNYLLSTKGATVVAQGGLPFENIYKDMSNGRVDPSSYYAVHHPEVIGIAQDRAFALAALTDRTQKLYTNRKFGFAPNFMDEWPFREVLKKKINDRLTKGLKIQDLNLERGLNFEVPDDMYSLNFAVEKPLLNEYISILKWGLRVPNKETLTNQRLAKYKLKPEYQIRKNNSTECVQLRGDEYCASKTENPEAHSLAKQYNSLQKRKTSWKISEKSITFFLENIMELIPAKGQGLQATFKFYSKLDKKMEEMREAKDSDASLLRDLDQLVTIFRPEWDIFVPATKIQRDKIKEEDLSKAERQAKFDLLAEVKLSDMATKIGKEFKGLDQEIVKTRLAEFMQTARNAYEEYQADPTEYDAQADILMNALFND